MFLTNVLLKKVKSKYVLVAMESIVSGHQRPYCKQRGSDKLEFLAFDPFINMDSIYVEKKKIKSIKKPRIFP